MHLRSDEEQRLVAFVADVAFVCDELRLVEELANELDR